MSIKPPNYTQTPNDVFALIPEMKDAELRVTLIIVRETFGWQQGGSAAMLSLTDLMGLTGLSRQGVLNGLNAGKARGTIYQIKGERTAKTAYGLVVNVVDQSTPLTSPRSRPELVNVVDQSTPLTSPRSRPELVNVLDRSGQPTRPQVVNAVDHSEAVLPAPSAEKTEAERKLNKVEKKERKNIPPLAAGAAVPTPELNPNPEPPTLQAPVPDQAQPNPQANASETNVTSLDTFPGGAAGGPGKTVLRLMAVYNTHRKHLPAAENANTGREKALKRLVGQFGGPDAAAAALADATQEVAADEFWMGKGWGLDNLLPKIAQKAEAWRARTPLPKASDPAAPPNVAFTVGQRVSYKRYPYTVEVVGETYIDLYDAENGSSRILFASSDFSAIKAIGGTA